MQGPAKVPREHGRRNPNGCQLLFADALERPRDSARPEADARQFLIETINYDCFERTLGKVSMPVDPLPRKAAANKPLELVGRYDDKRGDAGRAGESRDQSAGGTSQPGERPYRIYGLGLGEATVVQARMPTPSSRRGGAPTRQSAVPSTP